MPSDRPISSLVLSELYESGDESFLELISRQRGHFTPLLKLVERWKKDSRPWARRMKFDYILNGRITQDNRVVFKRLFKQAWTDQDNALMGAFMVVLDRSIRRARMKRFQFATNGLEKVEVLRLPPQHGGPFSTDTRHYLRRRAWRYFRQLGRKDAASYVGSVAEALARYTDDDVRAGENLLDNWGLMHACFGKSTVLQFDARHTNLSISGRLADLQAAPMFERYWADLKSVSPLLDILLNAQCRAVRVWTIQLLHRLHEERLARIEAATLLKLLDHEDPDVAIFAAELLNNSHAVAAFSISTWMALLGSENPAVVASIVQTFRTHVSLDRVSLPQAVELVISSATPVARLGLEILSGKSLRDDSDYRVLSQLAAARCAAAGEEIAKFALSGLNVPGRYRLDEVIAFFDTGLASLRKGAFDGLIEGSPADADPGLWARLFESPYDDVRFELIRRLNRRGNLPGASAGATALLWQSVLLNVHRGGRFKLSALRQISDRIIREPQQAAVLLPVLAVAIRSVRTPEARHGLAAIVAAVEKAPELSADVRRHLPELQLELAGGPQ